MSSALEYLWFKENAAVELAHNKKRNWTAQQWGWYSLLKLSAWNNDEHRGRLDNDSEQLKELAKASGHGKNFNHQWQQVISCFEVQDGFLVHPALAAQVKDKKSDSKQRSIAGSISATVKELAALKPKDPRRADLEKQLTELRSKTESGREAAAAAAPAAVVHQPGDISADGKMLWYLDPKTGKGRWMFQSQLEKMKQQLLAALEKCKSANKNGRLSLDSANQTEHTLLIQYCVRDKA